jgi:hypothetical protein
LAHLAQNLAGFGQKGFAEIGETSETWEAIEKLRAKLVFEFANLLRERRLRDVLLFGRSCEVSRASDGAEISQLMQFHSVYLELCRSVKSSGRGLRCVSPMNSIAFIY